MSVRRRLDNNKPQASAFSLRTAFSAAAPSASPVGVHGLASPQLSVPSAHRSTVTSSAPRSSLSFAFGALPATAPAPSAPRPQVGGSAASTAPNLQAISLSNNPFGRQPAPVATSDSLRYTAVIDELTGRMRKEAEKKVALENQVTRLQQTLASVKSEANAKLKALQCDLCNVQASEGKLRKELAVRPALAETKGAFESQVQAALEADVSAARATDAEKRVAEAEVKHAKLLGEVKVIEAHRTAAIGAVAPHDGTLSEAGVADLLARAATAAKRHERAQERLDAVKDDVQRFSALAESRRGDAASARREAIIAQAETAEAATDASAARDLAKEMHLQVDAARTELAKVRAEIAVATNERQVASNATRGLVTGASAPGRSLHTYEDTPLARVAAMSRVAVGTPCTLDLDCPLTIGTTGPVDAPAEAMVNAVVLDLQQYFQNSIQEHTHRVQLVQSVGA